MRFHVPRLDGQTCLHHRDLAVDDDVAADLAQPHPDEFEQRDLRPGEVGLDPQLEELEEDQQQDEDDQQTDDEEDGLEVDALGQEEERRGERHRGAP